MSLIMAIMFLFVDATLVSRRSLPKGFRGVSPAEAAAAATAFPGGITREQAERASEVFLGKAARKN